MRAKKAIILFSVLLLLSLGLNTAFSEGNVIKGPPMPGINTESEMQWVWGEVVLIDPINKKVLLKYLDYETDMEKEISIIVDAQTLYDNISSLEQLRPGDPVSVDYIVNADGINIARNISIEKPQESEDLQAPLVEENPGMAPNSEIPPATYDPGMQAPLPGMEQKSN